MEKAKLLALIAALYLLEIRERTPRIKETAKENGVDEGGLFKALKEAGYNPKAEKGTAAPTGAENAEDGNNAQTAGTGATVGNLAQQGADGTLSPNPDSADGDDDSDADGAEKITVTLRHKTEYKQYRRAGLILKQTPAEFRVTAEQLATLEKDKWVEITRGGGMAELLNRGGGK